MNRKQMLERFLERRSDFDSLWNYTSRPNQKPWDRNTPASELSDPPGYLKREDLPWLLRAKSVHLVGNIQERVMGCEPFSFLDVDVSKLSERKLGALIKLHDSEQVRLRDVSRYLIENMDLPIPEVDQGKYVWQPQGVFLAAGVAREPSVRAGGVEPHWMPYRRMGMRPPEQRRRY